MTVRDRVPDFVFENVGSHGDIMPLLSVAAELAERGYRCQLLGNEHFRAAAFAQGVGFYPSAVERTHASVPGSTVSYVYFKFDRIRDYFRQPHAFDERTVVVNSHHLSGSEPLAEAHGLRTVRLTLFPVRIPSLLSPPWPLGARGLGPEGKTFLEITLPAMYRAGNAHPDVLRKINSIRAELGLGAVHSARYERQHLVAEAAMFPSWFGMPAPDWPELEFLGFPLPASSEALPERLLQFLQRHPRPLVFTPGTGFGQPQRFFDAAARCCATLGMPGIFLSPFIGLESARWGASIAHFEHVELAQLLPHAALIVHHGGMGTTARALQAGIPQIISPVGFDQPDNGHRVEVLGTGRVVPRELISGSALATTVRQLLTDPQIGERLACYRAALTPACGVQRAADLLERVTRGAQLRRALRSAGPHVHCTGSSKLTA